MPLSRPNSIVTRLVVGLLATLASGLTPTGLAAQGREVRPVTVLVRQWYRDTADVRLGVGKLFVVVRLVEAPTQVIVGARVLVQRSREGQQLTATSYVTTDSLGAVRIEGVAPGNSYVRILALAYKPILIPILIVPGCVAHVEVYMALDPFCQEGSCPDTPPRATLTVCRPNA